MKRREKCTRGGRIAEAKSGRWACTEWTKEERKGCDRQEVRLNLHGSAGKKIWWGKGTQEINL